MPTTTKLYLDINLDPNNFPLGNYNIIVDNGGRFNKFIINTDIGHDIIDDELVVSYNQTLVVPTYTVPDINAIYGPNDIPGYNGYYGWDNAVGYNDLGSGVLIGQSNFGSGIPGQKPYSTLSPKINLIITEADYYIFDLSISTTSSNIVTPILYILNTSTNYLIMYNQGTIGGYARILCYMPVGAYQLIPGGLVPDLGADDAIYSVRAIGNQFGDSITSFDTGYSTGKPVDSDFNFNIGQFKITLKDLERESTVNISFCDYHFNELVYILPSLIYIPPDQSSTLIPTLMEQSSNRFKAILNIPSACCFANKITLGSSTICSIPPVNKVEITNNNNYLQSSNNYRKPKPLTRVSTQRIFVTPYHLVHTDVNLEYDFSIPYSFAYTDPVAQQTLGFASNSVSVGNFIGGGQVTNDQYKFSGINGNNSTVTFTITIIENTLNPAFARFHINGGFPTGLDVPDPGITSIGESINWIGNNSNLFTGSFTFESIIGYDGSGHVTIQITSISGNAIIGSITTQTLIFNIDP